MFTKILMSILFMILLVQAYGQTNIVGKWRPLNPKLNYQDTNHKHLKFGDLEIRSDSTFHIEGDSSTINSTIPGWHTGDEYNGTWELRDSNSLTLWLEPKENKMFFGYIVIKLTQKELVLRSLFDRNNKKKDIKYLRL